MTVLPERLWRVAWWASVGFPEPMNRRRTQRTFGTADAAARQVAAVKQLPTHCDLIGVWVTPTAWEPVDPDTDLPDVPGPMIEDDDLTEGVDA